MNKFLRIPESNYTDFYDIARFRLAWQVNAVLSIALFIIAIFFLFTNTTFFLQYACGFLIAFAGLIYLKKTHRFRTVSFFVTFSSLILVLSSLIMVRNIPHFVEPLWLIVILIFAYYNLGVKWGTFVLGIAVFGMIIYFSFFLRENLNNILPFSTFQLIGLSLEVILALSVIGIFISTSIKTTLFVETRYKEANEELNEQNQMIALQNEEKTVLLQEIHHRVKNNLQVITSLLRLQSGELHSDEAKSQFSDAINRIMTMSLIHQKMYQSENLSRINASDYFTTLLDELVRSGAVNIPVQTKAVIEIKTINSSSIVPLALLISELVSNSLKHAFEKMGQVEIHLTEKADVISLTYSDNGRWKNQIEKESFGLQLIDLLTEQMDGKVSRKVDETGTYYSFELKHIHD